MPQAVILPSHLPFRRNLRSNIRHTDGLPLDADDLAQYDDTTVFYDVFFNIGNSRLYLLGPPLLNLKTLLIPLTLTMNGQLLKPQIEEYFKGWLTIAEVNLENIEIHPVNRLEIDFNGQFTFSGDIPGNNLAPQKTILSTLQKNNQTHWIKDWVSYYRNYFAIDQIVIYDNGSANYDELKESLPDVVFEDWPFKHGITQSHLNKYCQYGSLNHCRLKYGDNSTIFNFDIDELLCYPADLVSKHMMDHDILFFDKYNVPIKQALKPGYSYADFDTREASYRDRSFKYIYKSNAVVANSVHFARMKKSNQAERVYRQLARLHKRIWRKSRRNSYWLRKLSLFIGKLLRARFVDPENEGYFLHYYGITTNWKGVYYDRLTPENSSKPDVPIEAENLERIRRVIKPQN